MDRVTEAQLSFRMDAIIPLLQRVAIALEEIDETLKKLNARDQLRRK